MKIFISYAVEDIEIAKKLCNDLKSYGHDPWINEIDLLPGIGWKPAIRQEISKSDFFISLLSETMVSKIGFVQAQQKAALEELQRFPESEIFFIPARINNCKIPFSIQNLKSVDLFPNYEAGLDRLLKALETRKQKKSEKPEKPQQPQPVGIYISFSVIDNSESWVTNLVSRLKTQTWQRLGTCDHFSIFMDNAANEQPEIPKEIIEQIQCSSIFIPIVSPGYIKSPRCERERLTFLRATENRAGTRLMVIEREKIDETKLPLEIKKNRPCRFWIQKQGERHPKILVEHKPDEDQEYFNRVNELSHELANAIENSPSYSPSAFKETGLGEFKNSGLDGKFIYLAEVTEDMFSIRAEVQGYLKQAGFRVLPENRIYLTDTESCKNAVNQALAQTRIFVQLLGKLAGKPSP